MIEATYIRFVSASTAPRAPPYPPQAWARLAALPNEHRTVCHTHQKQQRGVSFSNDRIDYGADVKFSSLAALTHNFIQGGVANPWFRHKLAEMKLHAIEEQEKIVNGLTLQVAQIDERLNRLTDAYIDRLIEKDLFEQRKSALVSERASVEQRLTDWKSGRRNPAEELLLFLKRADSAYLSYKHGLIEEKRDLLDSVTSNRFVSGKTAEIMLSLPFRLIANRFKYTDGSPRRNIPRT